MVIKRSCEFLRGGALERFSFCSRDYERLTLDWEGLGE